MKFKTKYIAPVGGDGIHTINTGDWRIKKPVLSQEKCVKCGYCLLHCPVNAISKKDGQFTISYSYCKGCGICAHGCPPDAIEMVPEVEK